MNEAFETLGLQPSLLKAITKLGFDQPTPIQEQAIPVLLAGRNMLGQAQTGTGKTAAFILPLLQTLQPGAQGVQALVLAPTRELAIQVSEAAKTMATETSVSILPVYGGQSYEIQKRQLKRGVDVVIGTPGRLLDLVRQKVLDLSHVRYLVLDEADEMLDMGFLEDVETVLNEVNPERQMALFSATLPDPVRRLAQRYLEDPVQIVINATHRTVEDTEQQFVRVSESQKLPTLIRLIEVEAIKYALIFAKTKARTQEIADELSRRGYPAEALHGDLSQSRREWVLNRFRDGRITLLVATDVAARGLDIEGITHVINFDSPADNDDYVHRIGRTGRAGRKGVAITLFSPRERFKQKQIETFTRAPMIARPIPTLENIAAQRDERLAQRMMSAMMESDAPRERKLIQRLAAEGADLMDLAVAALQLARSTEAALPTEAVADMTFDAPRERRDDKVFAGRSNGKKEYAGKKERYGSASTGEAAPYAKRKSFGKAAPVAPAAWQDGERPSGKRTATPNRHEDVGMIRLWMNLGHRQGIRPGDIVGAIAGEIGIPGRAIGEIDIHADHTFVDISEKHARDVLQRSSGDYSLRGNPVTLKLAE